MNSYERFKRMYEHKEADRVPIIDDPWAGALRRWRNEGMPTNMDWRDYFDIDKNSRIWIDTAYYGFLVYVIAFGWCRTIF